MEPDRQNLHCTRFSLFRVPFRIDLSYADFANTGSGHNAETLGAKGLFQFDDALGGDVGEQGIQTSAIHHNIMGREGDVNVTAIALRPEELAPWQHVG